MATPSSAVRGKRARFECPPTDCTYPLRNRIANMTASRVPQQQAQDRVTSISAQPLLADQDQSKCS
jgi:hypothetical protein